MNFYKEFKKQKAFKRGLSGIMCLLMIGGIFNTGVLKTSAQNTQNDLSSELSEEFHENTHSCEYSEHNHDNASINCLYQKNQLTQTNVLSKAGYSGKDVNVAVFDTFISNNYVDEGNAINFTSEQASSDNESHGSHMAEVLKSETGIAPQVVLFNAVVLDNQGVGTYNNIVRAIDWAVKNNVQIATMSFSGYEYSDALQKAVQYAEDSGVLIIAAAGNEGESKSTYPAKYATVLSVGAVDESGEIAEFSNYGDEVDVYASGVSERQNGTSVAVQNLAGIAALLWDANPGLNNREIRYILKNSLDETGQVNVEKAYNMLLSNTYEEDVQTNSLSGISNDNAEIYSAASCSHSTFIISNTGPTCTAAGYETTKCYKCGGTFKTKTKAALGHLESLGYRIKNAATCTETGTITKYCNRCDKNLSTTKTVSALGHSYGDYKTIKKATCTAAGTKERTCTRCKKATQSAAINKLGHDESSGYRIKDAATCTETGTITKYCNRCDKNLSTTKTVSALGHSYGDYKTIKKATCTAAGTKERTCTRCKKATQSAAINKLGHDESSGYRIKDAATCTETGTITKYCNRCDKNLSTAKTVSALGHSYGDYKTIKKATCTAAGTKERTCTRCKKATQSATISKLGHYESSGYRIKDAATCTQAGTITKYCNICDVNLPITKTSPKLPHNYGDYKTTKPATCTTSGTKERNCANCKKAPQSATIAPLGHSESAGYKTMIAATCKKEGVLSKYCNRSDCNYDFELKKLKTTPKTAHQAGDWAWDSNGAQKICKTCTKVMESKTLKITALDRPLQYENNGNITMKTETTSLLNGEEIYISIKTLNSSQSWSFNISNDARSWIKVEKCKDDNNMIRLVLDGRDHNLDKSRTGSVTIKSGDIERTITMTQKCFNSITLKNFKSTKDVPTPGNIPENQFYNVGSHNERLVVEGERSGDTFYFANTQYDESLNGLVTRYVTYAITRNYGYSSQFAFKILDISKYLEVDPGKKCIEYILPEQNLDLIAYVKIERAVENAKTNVGLYITPFPLFVHANLVPALVADTIIVAGTIYDLIKNNNAEKIELEANSSRTASGSYYNDDGLKNHDLMRDVYAIGSGKLIKPGHQYIINMTICSPNQEDLEKLKVDKSTKEYTVNFDFKVRFADGTTEKLRAE